MVVESKAAHALVIAAHPDDAEFGAAGTVARMTDEGKKVVYVVCTSGEKGSSDRTVVAEELARRREREQIEAARTVGVEDVVFLRHPDQGLEDTAEFREQLVRQIRTWRPHIVITSDPYRRYVWHRDHRVVGQVALDAIFPYARDHLAYPDLLAQGLEPHKVKEIWFFASQETNWQVDVTDTFERKVAALLCHRSQVPEFGIDDVAGWLRKRCRKAAEHSEYELAEAFHREVAPD